MAEEERDRRGSDRRSFLSTASTAAMSAGMVGGYGAFALISGRYLYPARPTDRGWQFVVEEARVAIGDSLLYHTPASPGGSQLLCLPPDEALRRPLDRGFRRARRSDKRDPRTALH